MKITAVLAISAVLILQTSFALSETKNEYWDNGKVRTAEVFDDQNNLIEKTYYDIDGDIELQEEYDTNGKKISLANFSKYGGLKESSDGWAAMKWKYSGGNMIGEGYYNAQGRLTEYKQYNEEGDLIDKKYFGDQSPDPNEEYAPIPPLAGESIEYYDNEGNEGSETKIGYAKPFFPYIFPLED
ncbi:MAG: DUF2963 domain-containing protein [Candidatus Omnitrophica bacterium]|nr:DUF2963 domain-containing protein [Candidatus Omnitrophota bacterium]